MHHFRCGTRLSRHHYTPVYKADAAQHHAVFQLVRVQPGTVGHGGVARHGAHLAFTTVAGAAGAGNCHAAMAKRCFVAKSGISMMLTRMEAQGLLRREADAKDGRIKRLYLSDTGEPLAQQSVAIQDEIVTLMMAPLSGEELAMMSTLAARVSEQLERRSEG